MIPPIFHDLVYIIPIFLYAVLFSTKYVNGLAPVSVCVCVCVCVFVCFACCCCCKK